MGLREYIVKRLIFLCILIFVVVVFNFFIFRLPMFFGGLDPVEMYIGPLETRLRPEQIDAIYEQFGLVRNPTFSDWVNMFIRYIINTFTFNFGYSFRSKQLVVVEIARRLPNTLLLMGISLLVAVEVGIFIGSRAAAKRGQKLDITAVTVSLFFYAMPIFWLGLINLLVFSFYLGWFPIAGTISRPPPEDPILFVLDVLHHLVLPGFTLSIGSFGGYVLLMRNSLIDTLTDDYILTARAKGLPESVVLNKHAMRNAFLPMLTSIALSIAFLINGATLTETVFNWYGMGRLIFESLIQQNWPVAQAIFFIISLLTVSANLIADLLYGWLDPRIKYG
ncbi:MAG: ABC transporter permease [Candidatus Ranarchaeia archaeon]